MFNVDVESGVITLQELDDIDVAEQTVKAEWHPGPKRAKTLESVTRKNYLV